jgi:N-acetylmuramoyl-L-alanine amidase
MASPFRSVLPRLLLAVFGVLSLVGPIRLLGGEAPFERVVIDPGHGGSDPGANAYGLLEKHLTLDLAFRLEELLLAAGIAVELTRREDVFVSLEDRAALANEVSGTVFVSLHFNGHADRSISGIETLYWPGSTEGHRLASYIQGELGRRLAGRNRGFRPERLKLLELTEGTAVLIEAGFLTNRWESQRCGAEWYRQIVAEEIAQGLLRYRDS